MSNVAAFLVVLDKHLHPESAVATMDAVRQLKGVIGVRTMYNDVGEEVQVTRGIVDGLRKDQGRASVAADMAADRRAAGGA